MLAAPRAPCHTHAALHFVENEKVFVLITNLTQLLEPFAAEMIVTALTLDRLDDDGADVDLVVINEFSDFRFRFLFALHHVGFALGFR